MSRPYWVFMLLVVVVGASYDDARLHNCVQNGRSLVDLELAEDALKKAKQLYPNCGEEGEESESSICSEGCKKEKSLRFIDVALELISNAKKNTQICRHDPTLEHTPKVTTGSFQPTDCQDLQAAGHVTSGVYAVWPRERNSHVRVQCDMDTDGGGWTVIQRRGNFSQQENFDRVWQDYKKGFGNLERDFWLGNDNIFALSNQGRYSLRMDMTAADGETAYALFRLFRIDDEHANYTLHVRGHNGGIGDRMSYSNLEMFSTRDRKNNKRSSRNCAQEMKGGWWYISCAFCNPNGLYKPGVEDKASMFYKSFKEYVGLSSIDMKIKKM